MKIRLWLPLALVLVLVLAACQPAAPVATAPAQETPASSAGENQGAYPAPQVQQPQPSLAPGQSVYPDVQSGTEITWDAAIALINNREVAKVTEEQSLRVTLDLKDGRSFTFVEPNPGEILKIIQSCGEPCKDIVVSK